VAARTPNETLKATGSASSRMPATVTVLIGG
jgi:hypothetical protein